MARPPAIIDTIFVLFFIFLVLFQLIIASRRSCWFDGQKAPVHCPDSWNTRFAGTTIEWVFLERLYKVKRSWVYRPMALQKELCLCADCQTSGNHHKTQNC